MKTFKIGVAGAHSTGKTTFVTRLEDAFLRIGVATKCVGDLASQAGDLGFPILREHTYDSTLWILASGIARELELAMRAQVVIVDRPAPDALGYLYAALEHRNVTLPEADLGALEALTRHHSRSYNLLFKTAVDTAITIDRTKDRDFDEPYRLRCAAHIDGVFSRLGLCHYVLGASEHEASVQKTIDAYDAYRAEGT